MVPLDVGLVVLAAVAAYVTTWVVATDSRGAGTPRVLAFVHGALLVTAGGVAAAVVAAAEESVLASQAHALAYGMVGGAVVFAFLVLYHPSTNLAVYGCGVLVVLVLAGVPVSSLAYAAATFALAYAACRPAVVNLFGGSATTLFAVVVTAGLGVLYKLDVVAPSSVGRAVIAALPILLVATGHPSYLHTRCVGVPLVTCASTLYTNASRPLPPPPPPLSRPPMRVGVAMLLALVVAGVTAAVRSNSHTAAVAAALCVALLADYTLLQALRVHAVVALVCEGRAGGGEGFGSRWVALVAGGMIVVGLAFAATPSASPLDGATALVRRLAVPGEVARFAMRYLPSVAELFLPWHLAAVSAALLASSFMAFTGLARATSLLTHLVADGVVASSGGWGLPVATLTFSGDLADDTTPALLAELRELGAAATFFLPASSARGHATLVRSLVAAGHEVGSVCPYDWDAREEDVARRVATQVGDTQRGADGAVVALSSTPPAHLLAPGAAGRAALPPLDALRATVRALRAASPGLRFVTLSTAAA